MRLRLRRPSSKNQWVLFLLGAIAAGGSAIPLVRGVLSLGWAKTEGVITYSRDKPGFRIIGVDVGYRYTVGGRQYSGDRYRFQSILVSGHMRSRDVRLALGRYPAGERVQVSVNPGDAADSVLEAGPDIESLFPFGLGLLLLLLSLGDVQKGSRNIEIQPAPAGPRYRIAKVLGGIGAAVFLFGAWQIYKGIISEGWPVVEGRIVFSQARTGRAYETLLWYEYYIGNQRYLGSNYRNGGNATPLRSVAQAAAQRYPEGQVVKVHYNPGNPKEALLEPGVWYGNLVAPILGVLMVGIAWLAKKYAEAVAYRRGAPTRNRP